MGHQMCPCTLCTHACGEERKRMLFFSRAPNVPLYTVHTCLQRGEKMDVILLQSTKCALVHCAHMPAERGENGCYSSPEHQMCPCTLCTHACGEGRKRMLF